MKIEKFLEDVENYFKGSYRLEHTDAMRKILTNVSEGNLDRLYDHLIDTQESRFMISRKQVYEALRELGIPYHKVAFVAAEQCTCEACGHEFRYAITAGDDDMLDKRIFNRCPKCGFFPHDTKTFAAYGGMSKANAKYKAAHSKRIQECLTKLTIKPWWNEAQAMRDRKRLQVGDKVEKETDNLAKEKTFA